MSLLPMDSPLSRLLAFLALIASVGGHSHAGAGGSPAENYWKSALPNSPMPASLSHLLYTPAAAAVGMSGKVKPSNVARPLNSAIRDNTNHGKAAAETGMQSLKGNRNYGKAGTVTEMQSLKGNRNYGKAATATEMQSLKGNRNYGEAATVTETQSLKGNRNYGKAATVTETQLLKGNRNYGKAATATEAQSLKGNRNYGKAATATETQSLKGNRNYGKAATATEMQSLKGNRNYGKATTATEMKSLKGNRNYGKSATTTEMQSQEYAGVALYFLEEDIQPGKKLTLHFMPTPAGEKFLPRVEANAIPFSSDKIPQILSRFSVNPKSTEAAEMTGTLHECETPAAKGEKKACPTSLESMVDFATSTLETKRVRAVSTIVGKMGSSPKQAYTVTAMKHESAVVGTHQQVVACHAVPYAYAVFLCHLTQATRAYTVSVVGVDGTTAKAVAVCHTNTAGWNPMHLAFQMLKVKPGTVPVCHFLPQNDVVWTRSG